MSGAGQAGRHPGGGAAAGRQEGRAGAPVAAAPLAPAPLALPGVPGRREALYFALRNRKLAGGLAVVLLFLLTGIAGPLVNGNSPTAYVGPPAQPPSPQYWFGTTTFGQDVFAQFVHGLRAAFLVGALGGGIAAAIGMLVGFTAGYRGGLVDEVLNVVTNVFLVLPVFAVLLIIAAYLRVRSVLAEAVIVGLFSWPWVARAVRAQTFSLRARDFVDLARLSGVTSRQIIFGEIAPNMASYLFMVFILLFGGAILFAASLDFIGLGPTEGMSLGLMLNNTVLWSALQLGLWWWFIPPGLAITAIVGALYVMNVGLDEVFNPRLREL